MTKQTDILIIGGGIAGLTLASLLADLGIDICLVEPFPPKAFKDTAPTGRTVALMQSSLNILKPTGAWEHMQAFANPLETMRIIDVSVQNKAPLESAFSAHEIGYDCYGYNIPNAPLRAALYEIVQKKKSVTIINAPFEDYKDHGGHIIATLGGADIKARLIVGADGRNSPVRGAAGIEVKRNDYDQAAMTCVVNHSKSHNNISTEFHRPAGPLAFVPLPGNQSSVVWVESKSRADEILKLKKQDFTEKLESLSHNILGGLTLEIGPECWPLSSITAQDLTAPRCALVAEAAHVMSPITAQGLNLSLRDIAALAETIADALRLGLDPGSKSILDQYAKRRRLDIGTRTAGVDRMNRIVSNDIDAVKDLRRAGLKTLERIPPLKRFAMRQGLAPQYDQGRLARGEAL